MLDLPPRIGEKQDLRLVGPAPSASAVPAFAAESGIELETLQRFLTHNVEVAEGRLTKDAGREMRAAFA